MITKLAVKNFKGFQSQKIELKPLTFFLGPNNSGKSALMAPLRLLAQTMESYDRRVPLLLNGKYGDFGTFRDLVFGNNTKRHITVDIEVEKDERIAMRRSPGRVSASLKYAFRPARKMVVLQSASFGFDGRDSFSFSYSADHDRMQVATVLGAPLENQIKNSVNQRLSFFHFLPNSVWVGMLRDQPPTELSKKQIKAIDTLQTDLRPLYTRIASIEYLSALRRAPSRTYAYSGERHARVGASGENAMSIMAMDSLVRGSKGRRLMDRVGAWLERAGMASEVEVEDLAGRFFEVRVRKSSSAHVQNLSDVGFGISQVLPVLVGGYNCEPNTTFVVEEPEIHLHPRAQAELGDFFAGLLKYGVQSIVETHSEHLIVRVLQHVASGAIPAEAVCFYAVESGDNGSVVHKIEVDGKGQFVGQWPNGFFPERLAEAKKLAMARMESGKVKE